MSVTINLPPEQEEALKARARAHGLSVEEWLLELAELAAEPAGAGNKFENLSDLLLNSPFAGANLNLERSQDYPRPVEIE
jgi:plasmid stability protein